MAVALVAPAAVQGQVFYDDDDSGGKEYAIPTDDARKQGGASGSGGGNDSGGGATSPGPSSSGGSGDDGGSRVGDPVEAFGEGISRSEKNSGADAGGSSSGSGSSNPATPPGIGDRTSSTTLPADTDDGGSSILWTVGFPLATLLFAAGIVLLIRRRRGPTARSGRFSPAEN